MKLLKILLNLICLLAVSQVYFGQEKPQAIQIDEFGNISCDDFLARTDNFFLELQNHPTSQGYVLIYGNKDDLRKKIVYELWTNGAIKFRNFDSERVIQVRGAETENIKIQFWRVPAGAEKPDFNEAWWDFVFQSKTKPFIFHDDFEQICSSVSFEKVFVEYLNANPLARGHVVIHEKSLKQFEKQKRETQDLLKDIPSNRLRYFFIKSDYSNTEYWLVPRKKK